MSDKKWKAFQLGPFHDKSWKVSDLLRSLMLCLGRGNFKLHHPREPKSQTRRKFGVGDFFTPEGQAYCEGKQFLLVGINSTTLLKNKINKKANSQPYHEHAGATEYDLQFMPGGGKFSSRMEAKDYKSGTEQRNSHAVAVRFPVDELPELIDGAYRRVWPLTLSKLDQSIHRVTGIFQVSIAERNTKRSDGVDTSKGRMKQTLSSLASEARSKKQASSSSKKKRSSSLASEAPPKKNRSS